MVNWKSAMEGLVVNMGFWVGKKVLITGHTGFKGSWMCMVLKQLGAEVVGVSLNPASTPNLFDLANLSNHLDHRVGDITIPGALEKTISETQPQIVFHMAAQSLVADSYQNPWNTYLVNVMGTLNVLESVRNQPSVKALLVVTSDKCYENQEWDWGYRENDQLGGHDLYSSSKACAEMLTNSYRRSFMGADFDSKVAVSTVRAGNVIGGGDWAENRLVPDAVRCFARGETLAVRSPGSIRPWQHVLEPLAGYMRLAEMLCVSGEEFAGSWNFGPEQEGEKNVGWMVEEIASRWKGSASWEIDRKQHGHEAKFLKLDSSKSRRNLGWSPKWNIDVTLDKTIEWYEHWLQGNDVHELCDSQIEEFIGKGDRN
jgi:CDP-glucose 4,6-dehydratase